MIELTGSIRRITIKRDVAGDLVKTVVLEVFGPVEQLNDLLQKPIKIAVEDANG